MNRFEKYITSGKLGDNRIDPKKVLDQYEKIRPSLKGFHHLVIESLTGKHYEPVQRNKDGLRWIRHRFPIKNGISLRDIMVRQATKSNALIKHFMREHSDDSS